MANYTISIDIALGSIRSGLTLDALLLNPDGSTYTALGFTNPATLGFYEIAGTGHYYWQGPIPTDFRGMVLFRNTSGSTYVAMKAIDPAEIGGTVLGPNAFDNIDIETGIDFRQTMAYIASVICGPYNKVDNLTTHFAMGSVSEPRVTGDTTATSRTNVTLIPTG